MHTPQLVEALLSGLACSDEACEAYPSLWALRQRSEGGGEPVPLQWALCTLEDRLALDLLTLAACALQDLLDAVDLAHEAAASDGCLLWHALRLGPDWLLRPGDPDDREPDVALVLERDEAHSGDWQRLLEALHLAGSAQWQWAIARCRAMQAFERRYALDVRRLLEPGDERRPMERSE